MSAELASLRRVACEVAELDLSIVPTLRVPKLAAELTRIANGLLATAAQWLAEAERNGGLAGSSYPSAAAFLAEHTGTSKKAAQQDVKLGAALAESPVLAEATKCGELSRESAGVVSTVLDHPAFPAHGRELVEAVKGLGPGATRREVDTWRHEHADVQDPVEADEANRAKRTLTFTRRSDGNVDVVGVLSAVDARTVEKRLKALMGSRDPHDPRTYGQRMADALVRLAGGAPAAGAHGPRQGATLLATITYEDLFERAGRPAWASTGETLNAQDIERLLCDANLHLIVTNSHGQPLFLGNAVRFAPYEHWLALAARDGGCRYEGCSAPPEECIVHHEPPMPGGATDIDKEVLLCTGVHHWQRHRRGTTAVLDPVTAAYTVTTPEGHTFTTKPRHGAAEPRAA